MSKRQFEPPSCATCAHSIIENGVMHCTLNPPANVPLWIAVTSPDGAVAPQLLGWVSGWPAVPPAAKCGQHKRTVIVEHSIHFDPNADFKPRPARFSTNQGL